MIQAAVMGYGTIGSGVVEVLEKNREYVAKEAKEEIRVKRVLDLREFPGDPVQDKITHDITDILEDPEIRIVIETMGGTKPAYDFVKRCILAGKSVCTSNKELVAAYGPELQRLARENHCCFLYEASVGGGIPIIRPLAKCLTSDPVRSIKGILNGTTNYILTRMDKEGADFDEVLKAAQALGYAEKNPTADVEGYDACRKIAILTSLVCRKQVNYEDIYTEGISKITAADFVYAKAMGCRIKLIAQSFLQDGAWYALVAPFLVSEESPLYAVQDVFNGILTKGDFNGELMFYGRGAGKEATACAVVADVIDAARHPGHTVNIAWSEEHQEIANIGGARFSWFVRVKDTPGILEEAKKLFGNIQVQEAGLTGECAFVTGPISENDFAAKAEKLSGILTRIRFDQ